MKRISLLSLLLVLCLTGCGMIVEQTDSGTDSTSETTTAAEIPTEEPSAPLTDAEKTAYQFILDELVPEYGLSDLAPFTMIDWRAEMGARVNPPPAETQGLASALVLDMNGDAAPELVTVRETEFEYYLEVYALDPSPALLGSEKIGFYSDMRDSAVEVTEQNGRIIVREIFFAVPGYSSYGSAVRVYGLDADGALALLADCDAYRSPSGSSICVGDDTWMGNDEESSMDIPTAKQKAQQLFCDAGTDCTDVRIGWGFGNEFGMEADFPKEQPVFKVVSVEGSDYEQQIGFVDDTHLRGRLSIG